MAKRNRPSFGRSKAERGFDLNDTPPVALAPLFEHEPLLAGVKSICEPFAGKGNLVTPMRARGITVYASDILDRGCPDSTVLDFRQMTQRPPDCDTLVSNPAYDGAAGSALEFIEHALKLEFRLIVLLLKLQFLATEERYTRLHPLGHLRRLHIIIERVQGMHDAVHVANGGKIAGQSQNHGWFVLDRNYYGKPDLNFVSINNPTARMPWANSATEEVFRYVRHADVPRFAAEGWEPLPALNGTHHGEYSVLMRRAETKVQP
jgi:hypothetical protein